MKITIETTTKIVKLVTEGGSGEVPARIWEGTTDSGIPVHCFVTRIAVANDQDQAQFERELLAQRHPSPAVEAYPLRRVL